MAFSLKKRIISKRTLLSFIVAFVVLYFLFKNINLNETLSIILRANLILLALGFILHYATYLIRGLRWAALLRKIGIKGNVIDFSEIAFLGQFVNCIIPAKLGDIYRGYLIKKNYGGTTSQHVGTIFVSRILDLTVLVAMLFLAGIFVFGTKLPTNVLLIVRIGSLMAFLALLFLFLFRFKKDLVIRWVPDKFKNIVKNFEKGTATLSKRLVPKLVFLTIILWVMEILRHYFVAWSLGFKMPFGLAIFIALAVSLITSLPLTPSGLGAAEAAIVGILLLANIEPALAFSIAIMDRFVGYWSQLLIGIVIYSTTKKA